MMIKKKVFSIILVVVILTGIIHVNVFAENGSAGSIGSKTNNGNIISDEVQMAINSGIVPKGMPVDGNVTAKELLTLLTNCIKLRAGNVSKLTAHAINTSANTVWRQDAAIALFYSAKAMGINESNAGMGFNPTDNPNGIKWDSKLFSDWEENIPRIEDNKTVNYPKIMFAGIFVCEHESVLTGCKLMEVDSNNHFNFTGNMTRKDAILASYRLYTSFEEKPVYVPLDQVGKHTIPAELLNKQSSLPEVSNQKIPDYKGFYNTHKTSVVWEGGTEGNRHFKESEIRFLSENGFNFMRISFSFSTLGYPDYPEGKVNENELRELDQLIAWGIKHDVHMCLAMCGLPGFRSPDSMDSATFVDANKTDMNTSQMFGDPKMEKMVFDYWQMLAKRYKDVPTKFLSFLLIVEPGAPNDKIYTEAFAPIVQTIRNETPDRVIFSYANAGEPCEGLAKMGCAMAWSFYVPAAFNYYGSSGDEVIKAFPYIETPKWPMLYLPGTFNGYDTRKNKLVINGNFAQGTIGIYVNKKYHGDSALTILVDDKVMLSKQLMMTEADKNTDWPKEECVASIPAGTKKIEIKVKDDTYLSYGRIQINQDGKKSINLYPYDLWGWDPDAVMPTLIVKEDGTVATVEKDLVLDFDYLFNWDIKPRLDLAKKYNVGFMLTEWGPFGEISKESRLAFEKMMLDGFEQYGIPWCYHVLVRPESLLSLPDSTTEEKNKDWKYEKLEYDSIYYKNIDILNLFRQYTVK